MIGGDGDDTYFVNVATDMVTQNWLMKAQTPLNLQSLTA